MKLSTAVVALALGLAIPSIHAAECDPEEVESLLKASPEFAKVETICNISLGSKLDGEDLKSVCANPQCLNTYKAAYASVPKCTVDGTPLSTVMTTLLDTGCELIKGTSASDLDKAIASSPASTTTTATAVAVAAIVGVVAVL